jgi:hypothetical protein
MLRPSNSLLDSSRATQRASVRAERVKALGHVARSGAVLFASLWGTALDVVLLCCLPLSYLVASYLALDLPARWAMGRQPLTGTSLLIFVGSLAVCLGGIVRALLNSQPIAPVRPRFAKAMLALGWVASLLFTIGDLAF